MTVGFFARVRAGAIKAPVGAARATILGKNFSKMLPGPMKPHGKIILCNSQLCRGHIRLVTLQIHFLQQLPVSLGHQRQETPKTLAECALILFIGSFRKLLFETLQRTTACPLFPININN
jgi:hypothetical protein